jgi:hypothetical protein
VLRLVHATGILGLDAVEVSFDGRIVNANDDPRCRTGLSFDASDARNPLPPSPGAREAAEIHLGT